MSVTWLYMNETRQPRNLCECFLTPSMSGFEEWENFRTHKRGDDYDEFKEKFAQKLLEILYEKVKFIP